MTVVRDRRKEPSDDKYTQDKIRYRDLHIDRIREALRDKIANDTLENLGKGVLKVPIPKETTHQPIFHHAEDGSFHKVFPGNVRFDVGDRIKKGGGGGGGRGNEAGDGEGEDDFIWVNEEDIKEILFEGRTLPDMTKLKAAHVNITERRHAGYTNKGPSHRMDMKRTNKKRRNDEIILSKVSERRIINNLTEQFNILAQKKPGMEVLDLSDKTQEEKTEITQRVLDNVLLGNPKGYEIPEEAVYALHMAVAMLKRDCSGLLQADDLERMDTLDHQLNEQFKLHTKTGDYRDRHLTYEYDDDFPKPSAKAVMFCLMDVSGSMDQEAKNNAKVFFWLLKEFLNEAYDQVELVFIAHTTEAKEVDQQEFFYGQETGGTLVSTCLQKTKEIIAERYPPSDWNIYSAQASDGDNDSRDNANVSKLMEELLPNLQSHYYIEVINQWSKQSFRGGLSDLGQVYEKLAKAHEGKVHVGGGILAPKDSLEAFKHFFPVGGKPPVSAFAPSGP